MRQKLSFGIWTNASSPHLLFASPVTLGEERHPGLLEVSSDSEGKLNLRVIQISSGNTVASSSEEELTPRVSEGHWLRVSVLTQHDQLKVQVEGGAKGKEKWAWQLEGQKEKIKSLRFIQQEPEKFGK